MNTVGRTSTATSSRGPSWRQGRVSLVLRVSFVLVGTGALVLASIATPDFLARHFSPDAHITETIYATLLRGLLGAVGVLLAIVAVGTSPMTLRKCAALMVAVTLTLGAFEIVLRLIERVTSPAVAANPSGLRPSSYPGLLYENSPNFIEDGEQKFNSLGMRDEDRAFNPQRPTIVVLGDSIEAWRELPVRELYPRRIEEMLNARSGLAPVQVINLAVTGYGLHQKILMLQHRGLEWHPSLVILSYCLNDPLPAMNLVEYFRNGQSHRAWRSAEFVGSRLRFFLHQYGVDFYSEGHREGTATWQVVVQDFGELSELARKHQFGVLVVVFPLMVDTAAEYPWLGVHRRVGEVARRNGLTVVDLLEPYQVAGFANVRVDEPHPNGVGHRIAAEKIVAAVTKRGLLGLRH